jgi:hypothetical protein
VGQGDDGNAFWMVADVMAVERECGVVDCVVQPLYMPGTKSPYIVKASQAKSNFGPTCPAAGDAGVGCY